MSTTDQPSRLAFERHYPARTDALGAVRDDLASWLGDLDLSVSSADVTLVLSELCSNAIEASPGETFTVRAEPCGGRLTVAVRNPTTASLPPRAAWRGTDVLAPRGRGLAIVDLLSDSVVTDTSGGFLTVTVTFEPVG